MKNIIELVDSTSPLLLSHWKIKRGKELEAATVISTCTPMGVWKARFKGPLWYCVPSTVKWTELDLLIELHLSAIFERNRISADGFQSVQTAKSRFSLYTWLFYTDMLRFFVRISICTSSFEGNETTRSKEVENTQVRVLHIRPASFWG